MQLFYLIFIPCIYGFRSIIVRPMAHNFGSVIRMCDTPKPAEISPTSMEKCAINNTISVSNVTTSLTDANSTTITTTTPTNITSMIKKWANQTASIPGIQIGIPLTILTAIFTQQHYGVSILNWKLIILQFIIGLYTYGSDRYYDALEYKRKPFETTKVKTYEFILSNERFFRETFRNTFYVLVVSLFDLNTNILNSVVCLLLYETIKFFTIYYKYLLFPLLGTSVVFLIAINELHIAQYLPFVILLETTKYYVEFKQKYGILKPFYVSFMWVVAILILPCLIHDGNYSILQYPVDVAMPFLLLFSLTNTLDIKDVEEDKVNQIETLPVKYGKSFVYGISVLSILLFIELLIFKNIL